MLLHCLRWISQAPLQRAKARRVRTHFGERLAANFRPTKSGVVLGDTELSLDLEVHRGVLQLRTRLCHIDLWNYATERIRRVK